MANKIYSRSPRIISLTGTVNGTTKCELYITNTGTYPALPTYTLSKPVPSLTNLVTTYNISEYIREFISMNTIERPIIGIATDVPLDNFCRVRVKTYVNTTLTSTTDYDVYDGYGYYNEGGNPVLSDVHMTPGNYQYLIGGDLFSDPLYTPQWVRVIPTFDWSAIYTNLRTGVVIQEDLITDLRVILPCVHEDNISDGNIMEVFDDNGISQFKSYFRPVTECRYNPSVVEFVNKFGSWQRQHFFKVTDTALTVKKSDYNLYQTSVSNYSIMEGQVRQFNVNGKEKVILNSGIVNNDFFNVVKEIVLSERILINGLPYKVTTETVKRLDENISKINNYTLEFEPDFNAINNVV